VIDAVASRRRTARYEPRPHQAIEPSCFVAFMVANCVFEAESLDRPAATASCGHHSNGILSHELLVTCNAMETKSDK